MEASNISNFTRFNQRVEDYAKYRPTYPQEAIQYLAEFCNLSSQAEIADIGSGTGLLTELLLPLVKQVFAVEPNTEMREYCESKLSQFKNYKSIPGCAENSLLQNTSVDLITVAQAFHWFDRLKTQKEFRRILRGEKFVALLWNERQNESSEFMLAYEKLLQKYGADYSKVKHTNLTAKDFIEFFGSDNIQERIYKNFTHLEWEELLGRAASQSFLPARNEPTFNSMSTNLETIFEEHQQQNKVEFQYFTRVIIGCIK